MTTPEPAPFTGKKRPKHSIFRTTLLRLGLGLAAITLAGMAAAYLYVLEGMESRAIAELRAYIRERGAREEMIFALAEDNHAILRQQILSRLEAGPDPDSDSRFDQLFVRQADGITRNRPERFDGTRMAGVCIIDPQLPLTGDIRQRVLIFYDLVNQFGPAWHNRFQDTYISTPENIMVIYWPEVPRWCQDTTTRLYMSIEEYQWAADEQHNPTRETVWTGLFYDQISGIWMVSCATPVYLGDHQIATIGHDILLNELLERALEEHLEGTYNIVLRADGRLITHPRLSGEIERKGGYFDILTMGDDNLRAVYRAAVEGHEQEKFFVVNDPAGDRFLAVAHLEGVDWYFITVYPKAILADLAFDAARMVMLLGLLALLFQGLVLYRVIRSQVGTPWRSC
ncbi:cache domain-containing protein [Marinobacterium aestuariivivens]|uniref:Cache domain-containing protein n=1 Tax=Marinobacterium aestuariivivens TaxID=1698799 RepID=A0ABW1ZXN4_9GAMM